MEGRGKAENDRNWGEKWKKGAIWEKQIPVGGGVGKMEIIFCDEY